MQSSTCLRQWNLLNALLRPGRLLGVLLVLCNTGALCYGQGNLLLTPRRIVFEDGKRHSEMNVANTGTDTARYVISLVEMRMKEDGSFEAITEPDPGQNFASSHLRFFPRSVLLGPKEAQLIKVQVRDMGKLAEGEYRSHIYLRAVPELKPLGSAPPPEDSTTISVKLTAVFGFTIPVIIRVGAYDTKMEIKDVSFNILNDTMPTLSMSLHRTGKMSVYGDLSVDHVAIDGTTKNIYLAKGLAVYTPNTKRQVKLNLGEITEADYHSGTLKILYTEHADAKKKLAEAEIKLE